MNKAEKELFNMFSGFLLNDVKNTVKYLKGWDSLLMKMKEYDAPDYIIEQGEEKLIECIKKLSHAIHVAKF
ncbi:MAG: hypothetical protein ACOCRO_10625, partial [Halanaerobiales bacterium]